METMTKLEVVKEAISAGTYLDKGWIIAASALVENSDSHAPWTFFMRRESLTWFTINESGDLVTISDLKSTDLPFTRDEPIILPKDFIPSIKKETTTTWGVLLLNLYILHFPFGDKAPFWNEVFTPGKVDKYWKGLIESGEVDIESLMKSSAGASQLTVTNNLFVPTFTERTVRACPEAITLLNKLVKENKGKMRDPAVVASIIQKVYEIDKAWVEQDVDGGSGFLLSDKGYRVTRMEQFYGQVLADLPGDSILSIPLTEGYTKDKYTASINDAMKSSLDRGFNTALGGVAVKEIIRILFGVNVDVEDCKVTYGERVTVNKDTAGIINNSYYISGGKNILLTDDKVKSLMGKDIILRSPIACKGNGQPKTFCKICVGKSVASNPESIKGQGISWGSVMMDLFMQGMHDVELVVEDYDIDLSIT